MDQRLQGPAVTDWRELCEELADKLATCWPSTFDAPDCLTRARAALAEPEPEVGPTDEELNKLMESVPWEGSPNRWGRQVARATLARWGRPSPAPAEGEVE